uniref:Uncharacterized protein n=1 Tax=Moorena producens (strain JHB) TaxID=1454205 RepID=A0A1D9G5R2_MOOP1
MTKFRIYSWVLNKKGTGNRESGTGNRESGIGNRESETDKISKFCVGCVRGGIALIFRLFASVEIAHPVTHHRLKQLLGDAPCYSEYDLIFLWFHK